MGLAGLLGTVELKSRWSGRLWPLVPPEVGRPHARLASELAFSHLRRSGPKAEVACFSRRRPNRASGRPSEAHEASAVTTEHDGRQGNVR